MAANWPPFFCVVVMDDRCAAIKTRLVKFADPVASSVWARNKLIYYNEVRRMSLRNSMVIKFGAVLASLGGCGEKQLSLSITTSGTGGIYCPLGGELAILLSEDLRGY